MIKSVGIFADMILSIESSTPVCSVALHRKGQLLACYELFAEQSHSGMLTGLIENALRQSGYTMKDLEAVAISKGPGSYTGLRIGTSTAKGLCYALDIPLLAVDTLQAMALGAAKMMTDPQALLCPMIDARRMEVYMALFDTQLQCLLPTEAHIVREDSLSTFCQQRLVCLLGNGAEKCRQVLQHPNFRFLPGLHPSAAYIGELACKQPQQVDLAYFEPFYLKDFMLIKK